MELLQARGAAYLAHCIEPLLHRRPVRSSEGLTVFSHEQHELVELRGRATCDPTTSSPTKVPSGTEHRGQNSRKDGGGEGNGLYCEFARCCDVDG